MTMSPIRSGCLLMIATAAWVSPSTAQTYHRFSDGEFEEMPWDAERADDGGFVVAGQCLLEHEVDSFDLQALITKYDVDGSPEWWTHYGDSADQWACSIDTTDDGGYVAACINTSAGTDNLGVIKLDASGTVVWAKQYPVCIDPAVVDPVAGRPLHPAIRTLANGRHLVVGADTCDNRGFFLVLHTSGEIAYLRQHRQDVPNPPMLAYSDFKELPNTDLLVVGSIMERVDLSFDQATNVLVRIDALGNPIWARTYLDALSGEPIRVGLGIALSDDGLACITTTAAHDPEPGLFSLIDYSLTTHIDPANGDAVTSVATDSIIPANAGIRATKTPGRYEFGSASQYTRTDGSRAMAQNFYSIPNDLSGLGIQSHGLYGNPFMDGAMTAAVPPAPGACGWVFAGWSAETGATAHHVASTDVSRFSACAPRSLGASFTFPSLTRVGATIQSFNQILVTSSPWADGPARALIIADNELCSSLYCAPCDADCDHGGTLNIDDIDCFVAGFLSGDLFTADCDGNGVLNIDDIDCFVAGFLAGCP